MLPSLPSFVIGCPFESRMAMSYPGTGTAVEPGLVGSSWMPRGFAQIAQPVSVCHQWSTTGQCRPSLIQWKVSGSRRSPARNRAVRLDTS
nr:hypothetical protein BJQ95_01399 [Cryobacterium sp. SO1]